MNATKSRKIEFVLYAAGLFFCSAVSFFAGRSTANHSPADTPAQLMEPASQAKKLDIHNCGDIKAALEHDLELKKKNAEKKYRTRDNIPRAGEIIDFNKPESGK